MVWWCAHFVILLNHSNFFTWKYAVIATDLNEGRLKRLAIFADNFVGAPLAEFSWFTHTKRVLIIEEAYGIMHAMIQNDLLFLLPRRVKIVIANNDLILNTTRAQNLKSLRHLLLSRIRIV